MLKKRPLQKFVELYCERLRKVLSSSVKSLKDRKKRNLWQKVVGKCMFKKPFNKDTKRKKFCKDYWKPHLYCRTQASYLKQVVYLPWQHERFKYKPQMVLIWRKATIKPWCKLVSITYKKLLPYKKASSVRDSVLKKKPL